MASQADGGSGRIGFAALALPVAVGLALRAWNLHEQILGDDELHAVRAALSMPLEDIVVTWRQTDHSLPLTVLYRLWLDAGGRLSDGVLRAPALLGSIALIGLAPRLAAPMVGVRQATLWAWLLALAPMLVLYGRMVRAYSPMLALTSIAVLAVARYWAVGDRRFAAAYVGCGAGAIVFYLGAGPLVVSPLLVGLGLLVARPKSARPAGGWLGLAALAGGLAVVGGAALAPGWASLQQLIELKRGVGGIDLATAFEVLRLHAGTPWSAAAIGFWGLVIAGWGVLWARGQRLLALLTAGAVAGQIAGLWVLAPKLDSPTLSVRAFLVTLPMSLFGLAAALDWGLERVAARTGWGRKHLLAGVALAGLLTSPYLDRGFWSTSFRQHDDYLLFSRERPRFSSAALPAFYRELSSWPDGALVELPWHPFWGFGHAVPAYQERHGRVVWVANEEPLAGDPRLALRRYVAARPGPLLSSGARYAVVHLDLEPEEQVARTSRNRADETRPQPFVWAALREAGARARDRFDAAWGPPDWEGGGVVVWDLERIRAQQYAAPDATRILRGSGSRGAGSNDQ